MDNERAIWTDVGEGPAVASSYRCIERSRSSNITSSAMDRPELCHNRLTSRCMVKYSGRQRTVPLRHSRAAPPATGRGRSSKFRLHMEPTQVVDPVRLSACPCNSTCRTVPGTMPRCRCVVYPCGPHSPPRACGIRSPVAKLLSITPL